MINGNGAKDLQLKTGGKLEHSKVTAGMNKTKKNTGQAALQIEADDKLNQISECQQRLHDEAGQTPGSETMEQLRKIASMIGDQRTQLAQQTKSIEITATKEQYDLYLEGMSYPSG